MDIMIRELTIGGDEFIAIGIDPHFLPVYKLAAGGYYATKMTWWALSKFVWPDRIGAEEIVTEDTIEDRYGLLMDAAPRPVRPHDREAPELPLHRTAEPLTGIV